MNSQNLRSSPSQPNGFFSSFVDAYQAWRGSTQKMTPNQALKELAERVEGIFHENITINFEWLDRTNRLLWVLTSKGDVLIKKESDLQNILRLSETASSLYQEREFKRKNPIPYARMDPRKEGLTYEELLLQIQGRCRVLEELYMNVHCSGARIKELTGQLQSTSEEEKRLSEKLRETGMEAESLKDRFNKLMENAAEETDKIKDEFQKLSEMLSQASSESATLRKENRAILQEKNTFLFKIKDLEEEIKRLKQREGDLLKTAQSQEYQKGSNDLKNDFLLLKKENAQLREEARLLNLERSEVLEEREYLIELRKGVAIKQEQAAEALEISDAKLETISKIFKGADQAYKQNGDNLLAHSLTLDKLLNALEETLKN